MIAAVDSHLGIADEHGIPWQGKIPKDTEYFQAQTSRGVIVMGYQTYREFDRPLHDRENYVVSHSDTEELRSGFVAVSNLTEFFEQHAHHPVWVIGGASLFSASLEHADELYLTRLDADFHCTKFFPNFSDAFELVSTAGPHEESGISFGFQIWKRSGSS
jgi:dihydrofolate reductase